MSRRAASVARGALARGVVCACLALSACSEHPFVDAAMESAYRPARGARLAADVAAGSPYVILAGDLYCHVSPPDDPSHVVRGLAETVAPPAARAWTSSCPTRSNRHRAQRHARCDAPFRP